MTNKSGSGKNATNKFATNEHAVKRLNNLRTAGNIYEDSSNNTKHNRTFF